MPATSTPRGSNRARRRGVPPQETTPAGRQERELVMAAGPLWERGVFSPSFFTSMVRGSTASPEAPSRYRLPGRLSRSCGRRKHAACTGRCRGRPGPRGGHSQPCGRRARRGVWCCGAGSAVRDIASHAPWGQLGRMQAMPKAESVQAKSVGVVYCVIRPMRHPSTPGPAPTCACQSLEIERRRLPRQYFRPRRLLRPCHARNQSSACGSGPCIPRRPLWKAFIVAVRTEERVITLLRRHVWKEQ